jgi:hypothetical protein
MELLPWRTLHVASSSAALLIVIGLRSIMHFKFTRLVATYADQAMVRKPYYHKYLLGSISTAICTAWCTINTSAKKKRTCATVDEPYHLRAETPLVALGPSAWLLHLLRVMGIYSSRDWLQRCRLITAAIGGYPIGGYLSLAEDLGARSRPIKL